MAPQRLIVIPLMLLSLLCLRTALGSGQSDATELNPLSLAWMAGRWCGSDGTVQTEEQWLPPVSGQLLGLSRTVRDGRVVAFEFLRIDSIDGVSTYLAQPGGVPATAFARTDSGPNWVRFENPAHDFPQIIAYRREDTRLEAEIFGPEQDGARRRIGFSYERCNQ